MNSRSMGQNSTKRDIWRCLSRNLSYVEDSYLDNLSVGAQFVRPSDRRNFGPNSSSANHFAVNLREKLEQFKPNAGDNCEHPNSICLDSIDSLTDGLLPGTSMADSENSIGNCKLEHLHKPIGIQTTSNNLPDIMLSTPVYEKQLSLTDTIDSEEGVFLNMMDDFDSLETDTLSGRSYGSDDLSIDSINSPDDTEIEHIEDDPAAVLTEAAHELSEVMKSVNLGESEEPDDRPKSPVKWDAGLYDHDLRLDFRQRGNADNGSGLLSPDSPLYEDREFNFVRAPLRKSSSLKSTKTPPGTPRRKKAVRFADAMGLDLESVRHILNLEAPPKIPSSAMADLRSGIEEDRRSQGSIYLCGTFPQPGAANNFYQRVTDNKVVLENAIVTNLTITGVVRVANICFHKSVRVRYTINDWVGFYDIGASYVQNSCDGRTDRFSFSIVAPKEFGLGSRLQFAVSFSGDDNLYWDSNNGNNYVFECYARAIPTEADAGWMHFL